MTQFRKLPPLKAVAHALRSVVTYRATALRVGMFWIPVLAAVGLAGQVIGPPDPQAMKPGLVLMQLISLIISVVALSSMAVNWHRFILCDELGSPARLDTSVWRYAGNSLAIMLMILVPMLLLVGLVAMLHPAASIVLVAAALGAGAVVTGLSIKLPAVALGRTDFTFRDAWNSCAGNFWQLMGVFLLYLPPFIGAFLGIMEIVETANTISPMAGVAAQLVLGAVFQLFYTIFNASVFTSLYGFFVERRDF